MRRLQMKKFSRSQIAVTAATITCLGTLSLIPFTAKAHEEGCQVLTGDYFVVTRESNRITHIIDISVDSTCEIHGSWEHRNTEGGETSIRGQVNGDTITFERFTRGFSQNFRGRWSPGTNRQDTFAGGTYGSSGVWYMVRE